MRYELTLNDRAWNAIKVGSKRVEIRVDTLDSNFSHKLINSGDTLIFESLSSGLIIECEVLKNVWYKSIEELLTVEGTEYTLSSTNDFDKGVLSINSIPGYTDGIAKNGVYAIHLSFKKEV